MVKVTFRGQPLQVNGSLPAVGTIAPPFSLTRRDLSEMAIEAMPAKNKVFNIFLSVDTAVCSLSVKMFLDKLAEKEDVVLFNISKDLPFAQGRFCTSEKMEMAERVEFLSAFRSSFAKDYGIEIIDGPLKGLCTRCVLVLDSQNRIIHSEHVAEVTSEPDYKKVLEVLEAASNKQHAGKRA